MSAITAGFLGSRGGQGCTQFMLAVAWDAAENHRVLLVDADPVGGLAGDYLDLQLGEDARQLGMRRLIGPNRIGSQMIESLAVEVPKRPNLFIVPGLRGESGESMEDWLPRLRNQTTDQYQPRGDSRGPQPSIELSGFDLVLVDLGSPLAYPALKSPERAGEVITDTFQRVFVVTRAEPALLAHTMNVLSYASLRRGEMVLITNPASTRDMRAVVSDILQRRLSNRLRLTPTEWHWKPDVAAKAGIDARPMPAAGIAKRLQLVQDSVRVQPTAPAPGITPAAASPPPPTVLPGARMPPPAPRPPTPPTNPTTGSGG